MRSRWPLFLLLLLTLLAPRPAGAEAAKRVYAGVYLHDVTKFDEKDGVFDANLELWAKWLGDFNPARLTIANASEIERELIGEERDGEWHAARWRVKGTLRGEFPVHRFPFDHQTLSVVLELPERDGELVPDLAGSGMRERFSVTGWLYEPSFAPKVGQEIYRSDLGSIASEGQPTSVRRAAFEVTLHRPLLTGATKLFLPLLVILLVAVVALFVHPSELEVRASVGVTALLACFAFHFAVSDKMPNVAYITLADSLFLVAYFLTAALLVVSVIAAWLHARERERAWRRLDTGAVVAFPVILAVSVLVAFPVSPDAHATTATAVDAPRPPSARALLRVGINKLDRPTGGLVSRGVTWGTTRTLPDRSRIPVLVEEVPGITNNALRFLADGKLEVTWKLRASLRWSDGAPLTASDLQFALQVSPDPRIDDVRVVDDGQLKVRFKDRVAAALDEIVPLPRHALEDVYKDGGYEAVREYRLTHVVPSVGPYHIVEFTADSLLVLEANPHFVGAPPSIARIEIHYFPDDAALVAAFEGGAIDMISPNALAPETAAALDKRKPDAVDIRASESLLFLQPDLSQPLLARHEVREALLRAIDRDRLRRETFGESAEAAPVAHVPVPGTPPADTLQIGYDAEAARLVLEKAGAVGAQFPLAHGANAVDRAVAAAIVRDLGAVGVTVKPEEVKDVRAVARKRNHGGFVLLTTTGDRNDAPEKYWNLPQNEGRFDRTFRCDGFDDGVNALIEREERSLYPERREQIRDLLFAAYSHKLPSLPLVFMSDRIVADPTLDGWQQGSGKNFGATLERWHFTE